MDFHILNFLTCAKAEIKHSLYCGKWRKISRSQHDLDLDRTMPNVELIQAIFIYYNMFKFQVYKPQTIKNSKCTIRKQEMYS